MIKSHKILKLNIGATEEEVNKRYRELIKIFTPEEYPEEFKMYSEARKIILNELSKDKKSLENHEEKYESLFGEESEFEFEDNKDEDEELSGEEYFELAEEGFWEDEKTNEESLELYEKAVEKGCEKAYYMIGYIYYYEIDSEEKALKNFYKGALNDINDCYSELAEIYRRNKDYRNAKICYEKYIMSNEYYFEHFKIDEYERYLKFSYETENEIPEEILEILKEEKDEIYEGIYKHKINEYTVDEFKFVSYIMDELGAPQDEEKLLKEMQKFEKSLKYLSE